MDQQHYKSHILKNIVLAIVYGLLYCGLEILFRGRTHWTMACLGAVCGVAIGELNSHLPWDISLLAQGIIGSVIVTVLEFITGLIVNVWLCWDVWDYSDLPFNIMGQICLPFSILWVGVSIIVVVLDDWLRYWWWGEDKPHYRII